MVPSRKQIFESLISDDNVYVRFLVTYEGVDIPKELVAAAKKNDEMTIVFEYGMDMPIPITDLKVTDEGISATLSISRSPKKTFVPWDSICIIHTKNDPKFAAQWVVSLEKKEEEADTPRTGNGEEETEEAEEKPVRGLRLVP